MGSKGVHRLHFIFGTVTLTFAVNIFVSSSNFFLLLLLNETSVYLFLHIVKYYTKKKKRKKEEEVEKENGCRDCRKGMGFNLTKCLEKSCKTEKSLTFHQNTEF